MESSAALPRVALGGEVTNTHTCVSLAKVALTNQLTLLSCLSHVQPWGHPGGPKV